MAKSENQKLKLLYLYQFFLDKTDEEHAVTMAEIMQELERYEISANRKTIYSDIESLRDFGMDIEGYQKNNTYYYHLLNRNFELAELKLLVDSVQSSKFITKKKSTELIKKIEGLTSTHQAKQLQRQVFVNDRIKAMNESIYYNVDTLNLAINQNVAINFKYYEWNVKKELILRENGLKNNISPWALLWDDENYYLVAYDAQADQIKHYRVDKMREIVITDQLRSGEDLFQAFDSGRYAKKVFGMYGGKEENVTIEFENHMIGVVLDRFGTDLMIIPSEENHFRIHVDIEVSNMFLSWIMGLGGGARILGPDRVVDKLKNEIQRMQKQYQITD